MFKFGCRLPSCFRSIVVVEKNFKRYLSNEVAHQRFFEKRSQIINGKAISSKILSDLKCDIDDWINLGNRRPQLTAVVVGDHPASELYLKNKSRAAGVCGITADIVRCPKTISQRELLNIINDLNSDDIVDAILVQLPCPPHINEKNVFNTINVSKDVDGFNSVNIANLTLHEPGIVPCTALAVNSIIQELGKPGVIKGDSIKPGAIVIDVGITMMSESKGEKQKFVGDVEFEKARDIASYITPVPGGVGPVTVAMLMANTFHCAVIRKNRKMELDQANSMTED
ncbi:bifunctional methylenetetrahydrofolate dehydrogenase/cyclohydrolase, mitochondrial isoform X3 [Halyomorpha halys]|uniref:bifunctional methylenetetrahydrofolate dehydrogenase/cyclohydrolase, mitochondrial isoform X3 n=1 Tax=Halyomorpha halys TaxID=286706 RepID=UPI0006D4F3AE|nr:probable bifunctional methylenetetrahydrofolate dehydrogenase/cyclohydrolase 2 isoform X3 [Halyomorpha halys]